MESTQVERGLVGTVTGDEVDIRESGVGAAASSRDLFLTNGGAGLLAAAGNLTITNGGGGPMAIGGNVSITNGGAQTILAGGEATLGERSFVAFVFSPRVTVEPGRHGPLLDAAGAGIRRGRERRDPGGDPAAAEVAQLVQRGLVVGSGGVRLARQIVSLGRLVRGRHRCRRRRRRRGGRDRGRRQPRPVPAA